MRKFTFFLALCAVAICICAVFVPATANADVGPKPSVQITFKNMGDELCYGTLLSKNEGTGPYWAWQGDEDSIRNDVDMEIWRKFVDYQDVDGFYFLQITFTCSETKTLDWTYYPPYTFKVLLYYPQTDTFVVSEIYERYAFDSYYTINMKNVDTASTSQTPQLVLTESYNYGFELVCLVCRIVLTIAIEMGLALLFFRDKKVLRVIFFTNIATQVLLNVALNIFNYFSGALMLLLLYLPFELAVFVVELVVYLVAFRKVSKERTPAWKTVLYVFLANLLSFGLGLLISFLIPAVF